MKSLFTTLAALLLFGVVFSQSTEHYLQISINDRAEIQQLSRMVSVDGVNGNFVVAYANDNELAQLKKSSFTFVELEHPSVQSAKSIVMATTIEQMANWDRYPTYDVYVQMMQTWAANFPEICKLDTIGYSVQNRMLLALKISDNVNINEAEPEVLYSSTMHGDETTGMILLMRLADYLLNGYGTEDRATEMVNSIALYLAPNTNPDGTYYGGNSSVSSARRANYNGVDLNRDYPNPRQGANTPYALETQAMMDYAGEHHFILSGNFHGGIELVNYPWDSWYSNERLHADNDWYAAVSREYADLAQANSPAGYMTGENNGITHGADWYPAYGSRQDYMNYWHFCKEITFEVSDTKLLGSEQLPAHWNYNQDALLTYVENVYQGVRGLVTNSNGDPLDATITIVDYDVDNSHVVTDSENGDYYRMLLPGSYDLKFESYGYIPQTITAIVTADQATTLNVELQQASVVSVQGTVVSSQNGQPISGVSINLLGTPVGPISSNAQGGFVFSDVMEGDYQLSFVKEGFFSKTVSVSVSSTMEPLAVTMDVFSGFSFEDGNTPEGFAFSGNAGWSIVSGEAYDGTKSMKSGAISHNQTSVMTYTFDASSAGQIVFYAKVSTEASYDMFEFFIDNVSKGEWSGQIDWTEYAFEITEGQHTLKWEYNRDGSAGSGSDAVWVDFVAVPSAQSENPIPFVSPRNVVLTTSEMVGTTNVQIQNIGQGALNYTATIQNPTQTSWLTLTNATGSLTNSQSNQIVLGYNFTGLECGVHTASVDIDVTDSVISIPVSIDYVSGLVDSKVQTLNVFPNPANSTITIQIPNLELNSSVVVYSVSGKKLSEQFLSNAQQNFELSTLGIENQGIYFIRVKTPTNVYQNKLVVQSSY